MVRTFCVIAFVLLASSAFAQTPAVNPTMIDFDHVDFAGTDSYSVGYFSSATAINPVQEAPFVKPATCNPCSGLLPSRPTQFQTWYVGVRAIAGTTTSAWSALVPFVRVPAVPSNVKVR